MSLDLVYPLRNLRDLDTELRYSLRSACANLPHDRVWVVGPTLPDWLQGVDLIPANDNRGKWKNLPRALLRAAADDRVSEQFVLMNDDFFIMQPLTEVPAWHRGPFRRQRSVGTYGAGYRETEKILRWMKFEGEPVSYEVHGPMVMGRAELAPLLSRALEKDPACLHSRTLYGNLAGIGGELIRDFKVYRSEFDEDATLLSTNQRSWRAPAGRFVRRVFSDPCRYER